MADPRLVGERRPHVRWGGPRPANRPWGGAVMGAPSWVTPGPSGTGEMPSCSAVRDHDREPIPGGDGSAPGCSGGDVGAADQVAVPAEPAVSAGEVPVLRLGNPPPAGRAGRGRARLIDQHHADPGLFCLVGQTADQVPDPPITNPFVVPAPGPQAQDAARVPDLERADPATNRPVDDGLGGLMLGLAHPPLMPVLKPALPSPVFAPPPRPGLPRLGRSSGHGPPTIFGVFEVQVGLSPDRPPRHHQPLPIRPRHRERMDHPRIDPRHPARIRALARRVGRDRHFGGDIDEQPAALVDQRDRPDLPGRIGHVAIQSDPQWWAAVGGGQPQRRRCAEVRRSPMRAVRITTRNSSP